MSEFQSSNLEFIESSHTYLYNGVIIPSVTQIMRQVSMDHYQGISEEKLKIAAERGTKVHKGVELFEQGVITIDPQIAPYVTEYRVAKFTNKIKPTMQEVALTNGLFAGTIDMVADMNGQQVLIDLKATSKFNKELAEIQLAGYVELLEANGIGVNGCYILHLKENSHRLHKVTPNFEKWEELKCQAMKLANDVE